jgi:ABC-type nickel/cobalt efflux system permease component RcnA
LFINYNVSIPQWFVEKQRVFQNQMAEAVIRMRSGDMLAITTLLMSTATYGFVHAFGPGHGKYLIGGVGVGTQIKHLHLISIAVISSITQALWAIVLVYSAFFFLGVAADKIEIFTKSLLLPLSYGAIALVGCILVFRGIRNVFHLNFGPTPPTKCTHSHGPNFDQLSNAFSWRERLVLVTSVAIRPCTGAIFLLVITWNLQLQWVGVAAVISMGLGTAALTSIVAISSISARSLVLLAGHTSPFTKVLFPLLQVIGGTLIISFSLGAIFLL